MSARQSLVPRCGNTRAALAAGMLLTLTACGDPVLWKFVATDRAVQPTPQAVASETVAFDTELLKPPSGQKLKIPLPRGAEMVAVKAGFEEIRDGQYIWRGTSAGEPGGTVTLSFADGMLIGNIHTAHGAIYSIRYVSEGVALVEELDVARFPPEGEPHGNDAGGAPERPIGLVVDTDPATGRIRRDLAVVQDRPLVLIEAPAPGPVVAPVEMPIATPLSVEVPMIDVMVLYTQAAADYEIAEKPIRARIDQLIEDSTKSFTDSEVRQELRLAHAEKIEYQEKGNLLHDWQALKGGLSGSNDKRVSYGADVVVLLTGPVPEVLGDVPADSCGQASEMLNPDEATCTAAYAVVPINCAANRHSFAHEVGHVMGARHSRGFVAESGAWYTVMAYPNDKCPQPACQRILHWSNPSVDFEETIVEATGTATANNAQSLNAPGDTVAKYSDECGAGRQQ